MESRICRLPLPITTYGKKRELLLEHTTCPRGESPDQSFPALSQTCRPSSSILLEKSQHSIFSPYISQICEDLAQEGEGHVPTDNHIRYIIQLQRLVEEVSTAAGRGSSRTLSAPSGEDAAATLQRIKQTGNSIKSSLPFPLSDSRKKPPFHSTVHDL